MEMEPGRLLEVPRQPGSAWDRMMRGLSSGHRAVGRFRLASTRCGLLPDTGIAMTGMFTRKGVGVSLSRDPRALQTATREQTDCRDWKAEVPAETAISRAMFSFLRQ